MTQRVATCLTRLLTCQHRIIYGTEHVTHGRYLPARVCLRAYLGTLLIRAFRKTGGYVEVVTCPDRSQIAITLSCFREFITPCTILLSCLHVQATRIVK